MKIATIANWSFQVTEMDLKAAACLTSFVVCLDVFGAILAAVDIGLGKSHSVCGSQKLRTSNIEETHLSIAHTQLLRNCTFHALDF